MKELWVEKYRPKTVDEYVFVDQTQREQVTTWIREKTIPHLLFAGPAGTGKTTLAKVLIRELEIDDYDVLYVNGSQEGRKIDWLRDKLETFCQTMPFGNTKIVLVDEADYMNKESVQPALRNLMEDYSETVRFILTCNYPNRIIPPLHSRLQVFNIVRADHTEFTARIAQVLINEGVEFDLDVLDTYIKAAYPDMRKCLNLAQPNSVTGRLLPPSESLQSLRDWKLECVDLFKRGEQRQARALICQESTPEDADSIFRWMYDNLSLWGDTPEQIDRAILIIRDGLVMNGQVTDTEINLSATLVQLTEIRN